MRRSAERLPALWVAGRTYVGGVRRVVQARRTALVVSPAGLHVARRTGDGTWQISISLLHALTPTNKEDS